MNTIGNKIQIALIGSIFVISTFALVMLLINQISAFQNQQIIKTMTMEYSIISLSDELIKSYSDIVKNPENPIFIASYQSTHAKIPVVIATLKNRIASRDSQLLLLGVENTVNKVVNECDAGLNGIEGNDFLNFSVRFAQANKENDFVHDNVKALLQKELEYLSGTGKKSEQIYTITLAISLGIFSIIVFIMIYFARLFAKQLITPLVKLSMYAEDIANGNLQNVDKRTLKITHDETGSLTKSMYTMVDKLMEMLQKEQSTSEALKTTSTTIKSNNEELQRMNTLMVGRELKMMELKQEIENLKKELSSAKTTI